MNTYDAETAPRDAAVLTRTPEMPHAQSSTIDGEPTATVLILHHRVPQSSLVPERAMRCSRCGMTVHPAAVQHDQALLLASCCPRCDGQLTSA
jgi:hypothetical protein